MDDDLPAKRQPRGNCIRISLPGEKQQLEDNQADCPYVCRTAKKWEDFLSEQQLNLEEQERTQKDRQGKRQPSGPVLVGPGRGCAGKGDRAILPGRSRGFDSDTH